MVKIALDAGHGINTAGKRTPNGEREWSFNNKVLLACIEKLNTYQNVQILRLDDSTGRTDVPLRTRTNKANNWKADVLVSIHHNALNSVWGSHGGVETFTMNHPRANPKSVELAKVVNPRIAKAMGLRNRGVKKANLHMVRESHMPAILTEGGFMDSTTDIKALRSDAKLKAQGVAIAEGLASYFKLKPKVAVKPPSPSKPNKPNKPQGDVVRMFKPSTDTLKQSYIRFLKSAVKEGHLMGKWLTDFEKGKLTLDDAFMLKIIVEQRIEDNKKK